MIIVLVFNSCSRDDDSLSETFSHKEQKKVDSHLHYSKSGASDTYEINNSLKRTETIHQDSIAVSSTQIDEQEDPPVKNGNHWRKR